MSDAAAFLELTERLISGNSGLSRLGAGVVAAKAMEIAEDSRSFARIFEVAHALVLRECGALSDDLCFIEVTKRDERTQRVFYRLTKRGETAAREARQQ